jgi:hypothetical protein
MSNMCQFVPCLGLVEKSTIDMTITLSPLFLSFAADQERLLLEHICNHFTKLSANQITAIMKEFPSMSEKMVLYHCHSVGNWHQIAVIGVIGDQEVVWLCAKAAS